MHIKNVRFGQIRFRQQHLNKTFLFGFVGNDRHISVEQERGVRRSLLLIFDSVLLAEAFDGLRREFDGAELLELAFSFLADHRPIFAAGTEGFAAPLNHSLVDGLFEEVLGSPERKGFGTREKMRSDEDEEVVRETDTNKIRVMSKKESPATVPLLFREGARDGMELATAQLEGIKVSTEGFIPKTFFSGEALRTRVATAAIERIPEIAVVQVAQEHMTGARTGFLRMSVVLSRVKRERCGLDKFFIGNLCGKKRIGGEKRQGFTEGFSGMRTGFYGRLIPLARVLVGFGNQGGPNRAVEESREFAGGFVGAGATGPVTRGLAIVFTDNDDLARGRERAKELSELRDIGVVFVVGTANDGQSHFPGSARVSWPFNQKYRTYTVGKIRRHK